MQDRINEDDKLWTTVASPESVSSGIRVDISNWNCEGNILGKLGTSKLFLSDSKMLGAAEYSKLGE